MGRPGTRPRRTARTRALLLLLAVVTLLTPWTDASAGAHTGRPPARPAAAVAPSPAATVTHPSPDHAGTPAPAADTALRTPASPDTSSGSDAADAGHQGAAGTHFGGKCSCFSVLGGEIVRLAGLPAVGGAAPVIIGSIAAGPSVGPDTPPPRA